MPACHYLITSLTCHFWSITPTIYSPHCSGMIIWKLKSDHFIPSISTLNRVLNLENEFGTHSNDIQNILCNISLPPPGFPSSVSSTRDKPRPSPEQARRLLIPAPLGSLFFGLPSLSAPLLSEYIFTYSSVFSQEPHHLKPFLIH